MFYLRIVDATNACEFLIAIGQEGQGNVTKTNIVWSAEGVMPDICSLLTNRDLVFVLETE